MGASPDPGRMISTRIGGDAVLHGAEGRIERRVGCRVTAVEVRGEYDTGVGIGSAAVMVRFVP